MQNGHSWSIRRQIKKDAPDVYLLTTEIVLLWCIKRYTERSINYLFAVATLCVRLSGTGSGARGKLGTQFLQLPPFPIRWQIFPVHTCILIELRARTIIRSRSKSVLVCAERSKWTSPYCESTCVQNRHRHPNIFSLACVLIRAFINACHDAPHLSRMPLSLASFFSSIRLSTRFIPAFLSFACLLHLPSFHVTTIRIHIYIVSVYDIYYYCNKTIDHPSSHLVQFYLAYLHLLFHSRCFQDEIVINSLLPCRFFATIYNFCNARSYGSF